MKRVLFSSMFAICTALPMSAMALQPAFYVAANGNDSSAGTLAAPFATIDKCLLAMRGSATQKTCYIRGGNYQYTTSSASCYGNPFALAVTDNKVTLSYYPPDGLDTAHIYKSGGTVEGGICLKGTGIVVTGLDIGYFPRFAISSENTDNTITYNTLHDTTINQSNGTLFMNGNIRNNVAKFNRVYNSSNHGIVAQPSAVGNLSGVFIGYNWVYNSSTGCTDCGSIYVQDVFLSLGILGTITGNHIQNTGNKAIYLDDGTSGFKVTENVIRPGPNSWAALHIHGGRNNSITHNVLDMGEASMAGGLVFYQTSPITGGDVMSGNLWSNNTVLTAASNIGVGYNLNGAPVNKLTVKDDLYFGYASQASTGPAAVGGGDSSPTWRQQ